MTNIELELESMAHGGSALGRHNGRVVFVPYTIPGERITARVTDERGRVIFAEGVQLLDASADRVRPACAHFGPHRCNACHWQHIAYPAQLLLKQDVVADQLERLGGFPDADVRAVVASPLEWGYADQFTLTVGRDSQLGMPSSSGALIQLNECAVMHPDLFALYAALDLEGVTGLQSLRLQRGSDGNILLILQTFDDQPPELELHLPISANLLRRDGSLLNLAGDMHSSLNVAQRTFTVSAGSSIRPNSAMLIPLTEAIYAALAPTTDDTILNLYGGVGIHAALLAPHVRWVSLADNRAGDLADAEINLDDVENVDFIEGDAASIVAEVGADYTSVLIDAPADGLPAHLVDALAASPLTRVVIVCDDPALLARDGKRLAAHGFRLGTVQPLDLAPQTFRVTCVAQFLRG